MDSSANASPAAAAEPRLRLRSRNRLSPRKAVPLSRREHYVLWATLPLLLTCPWHAGSMLWWSNIANVALALLPVIVAFAIPLTEEFAEQTAAYSRRQNLKNLLRFPVFWLGLLFIGYVLIQALNYNWEFVWTENKRGFYMQKLEDDQYIHWLPSGMKSPFKWTNPWQAVLMWSAPWLVVCAMWSTFKRRKAWCVVLWAVAIVGALLAILGIAAQITAPDTIFWVWERNKPVGPFGPYTYRNQASAYMYMAIACSMALFFYYQRTQSRDNGIQWFAFLLGVLTLCGSVMSASRAGWIGTMVVLLAGFFLFVIRLLWHRNENGKLLFLQGLLLLCVLGGVGYFISTSNLNKIQWKFEQLGKQFRGEEVFDHSLSLRKAVAQKTLEMFEDNKWTGWGAGSFRYYFPVYQQEEEILTYWMNHRGNYVKSKRYFWTHAHSDWAQILAEYGIIGSSFLVVGLLYWLMSILTRVGSLHCEHWILLIGVFTMIGNAVLDIIFYNPSLVILFAVVLCATRGLIQQRIPSQHSSDSLSRPDVPDLKIAGAASNRN